jgi:hypothetical protein
MCGEHYSGTVPAELGQLEALAIRLIAVSSALEHGWPTAMVVAGMCIGACALLSTHQQTVRSCTTGTAALAPHGSQCMPL